MRSLVNFALICATTFGSVAVAEAMPTAVQAPAAVSSSIVGAEVQQALVVVRKVVPRRVIVRRPRRVVKRVIIR